MESGLILQMEKISKTYSNGLLANDQLDLQVAYGEIHGLAGDNGAGKSTLMKILYGLVPPDGGRILFEGSSINMRRHSPQQAIRLGIAMVHQHFALIPSFTVAENIYLGRYGSGILLNRLKLNQDAARLMERWGLMLEPSLKVSSLPVGKKQQLEIVKALSRDVRLLILDEPTAALTPVESEELFIWLEGLKKSGLAVIYISHRLEEMKRLCNKVSVIRQGRNAGVYAMDCTEIDSIVHCMTGGILPEKLNRGPKPSPEPILRVKSLTCGDGKAKPVLNKVSFHLCRGEILGIAAGEGSSRDALELALSGLAPFQKGCISFEGQAVNKMAMGALRRMGMAFIPSDRMEYGVALEADIKDNVMPAFVSCVWKRTPFLNLRFIEQAVRLLVKRYGIHTKSIHAKAGALSGGNLQKLVAARETAMCRNVLVASQPTRGVDVNTANRLHQELMDLRNKGRGVLLLSPDLNELLSLSDRVIVIYDGKIAALITEPEKLDAYTLKRYMVGATKMDNPEGGI